MGADGSREIPLLRMITRLNVGGPAIQAITLTNELGHRGYLTTLLRGEEQHHEASMDYLADDLGVVPVKVDGLRRNLGIHDLRGLWQVLGWIRRERPAILHTHLAKAGALGRIASLLMWRQRPAVILHTFHGHGFVGEFSRFGTRLNIWVERMLARMTTRLIAVSDEVKDDLTRLGIAPASQIEVIRLGFDLSRFTVCDEHRKSIRAETRSKLGIPGNATVVTLIARLVKIKRVDRFLAAARLLQHRADVWFLVVGDGELRSELKASEDAVALSDRLIWTGFERDIPAICFASDVVALTSDSEGTPVALIEAQAAGLPVVSTPVGGVETVVLDRESGLICEASPPALSQGLANLLENPERRRRYGERGREHCLERFTLERLVDDLDRLYRRLLAENTPRLHGRPPSQV
jgi:glycosyltransferase involved in cell wall biosynthesis